MQRLDVVLDSIAHRAEAITAAQSDWPCRKGCSDCCRSLAAAPQLTPPELDLLARGLDALPRERRRQIRTNLIDTGNGRICPLLDRTEDACLVYNHRPAACRAYGFYIDREGGLYCDRIAQRAAAGDFDAVVWGNQDAVEARLDQLGPRTPLLEWLRRYLA